MNEKLKIEKLTENELPIIMIERKNMNELLRIEN
jgi:hypothetical protein